MGKYLNLKCDQIYGISVLYVIKNHRGNGGLGG